MSTIRIAKFEHSTIRARITRLNSTNARIVEFEVTLKGSPTSVYLGKMLYSYETPVVWVSGEGDVYTTKHKWSSSTSRQIRTFVRGVKTRRAYEWEQGELDKVSRWFLNDTRLRGERISERTFVTEGTYPSVSYDD